MLSKINNHRIATFFIIIILVGVGYWSYKKIFPTVVIPQYTLAMAQIGTITQTVTGSGQISASNQTDIQSQVSGTIKTINVSVGQTVRTGDLIATIDSVNAETTLQNSKISFAKLTQPAKEADVSNAQNNLAKAYDSGFNTVVATFLDLPTIMNGIKDLLYTQTGFLSDQNSPSLSSTGRTYRDNAEKAYVTAVDQYQKTLQEYNSVTRSSPNQNIDTLLSHTYTTIKAVAEAAKQSQSAVNFIITSQPDYLKSTGATALSNTNTWSNTANSDVSNVVSAQNSITSSTNSLQTLMEGTDALDIESARLSLEQAQRTYNNYFIRAPYDGIIGRIPVNVYNQAGSATTIATIVGQQKIATISLNEVDAAKVRVGQLVNITFDAIDDLAATGTVSVVDQIGTVSSGVVSYGVKILVNTDDIRIKPGMSVNTTIITLQKENVMVVPSASIKKLGNSNYVQSFDMSVVQAATSPTATASTATGTRTYTIGSATSTNMRDFSSTTNMLGTTTARVRNTNNPISGRNFTGMMTSRSVTISTSVTPTQITVTTGDSDDTNTEITSGLNRGQFVVTKTVAGSTATTSTAPSILSGIGGNRTRTTTTSTGSAVRTTSAGAAGGPPPGM